MRRDESGSECPATLGEYRALCAALAPTSAAVAFLDAEIAKTSADEEVIAPDSQMRALLMPLLLKSPSEGKHV